VTAEFQPIALICNARAGRGRLARAMPVVRAWLDDNNLAYEVLSTDRKGHGRELARRALDQGARLIVAVGGDGTIHEVVNGMIENDAAVVPEAALAVISVGSGCDFIKTFGISPDPEFAVKHLGGPESFPIDIGKVTFELDGETVTRYFANIAEVGLGAAAVERAARLPRWLGPLKYFFAFWLAVRKHKGGNVVVDLVDKSYEGYMNNMVVANGQFFGGGMKVAPKAAPTDGLLDVQIEHARRKEAIALLPKVYKGEHVPHPDIEEAKRVRISITSERPLPIEADGELLGQTPATFEVLKDAIRLKV
jgi:YegS/Rv2252/BmrU family lipid kinase